MKQWAWVVIVAAAGCPAQGTAPTTPARTPEPRVEGPAAAAAPVAVKAAAGPFADLDAYCAAIEAGEAGEDCWIGKHEDFEEFVLEGPLAAETPLAPPFTRARFVAIGIGTTVCRLALETGAGWWVVEPGCVCLAADTRSSSSAAVAELAVRDALPGGASELVLRYRELFASTDLDGDGREMRSAGETLVVCGAGASGRPACTTPLEVAGTWSVAPLVAGAFGTEEGAYQLDVEWRADAIVVRGDVSRVPADGPGGMASDPRPRLGRHPIAFP